MFTRRLLIVSLLAPLACLLAVMIILKAQAAQRPPFIAQMIETYSRADGPPLRMSATHASRADGSFARARTVSVKGREKRYRLIMDLSTSTQIAVSESAQSATLSEIRPGTRNAMREASVRCNDAIYPERAIMFGLGVVHVKTDLPTGTTNTGDTVYMTHDDWQAPELGCFSLKRVTTFYKNSAATGTTIEEAVAITLGAPPPDLFEVPEGYTKSRR